MKLSRDAGADHEAAHLCTKCEHRQSVQDPNPLVQLRIVEVPRDHFVDDQTGVVAQQTIQQPNSCVRHDVDVQPARCRTSPNPEG